MRILNSVKYYIHQSRLTRSLDQLKFQYYLLRNVYPNYIFRKKHPEIPLPPEYMLYEAYGLKYQAYFNGGQKTAVWLVEILKKHIDLTNTDILDWGCGPARIVRHLPALLLDTRIYGTDYNHRSIRWCRKNIQGVSFSENDIAPPLNFSEGAFDVIYGISIFTHLSEKNHPAWLYELHRALNSGGLLLITTQGSAYTGKLIREELDRFKNGKIVVREGVKEGHLTYNAFQPESYIRTLISGYFEVLEYIPGKPETWGIGQDTWVMRKTGDGRQTIPVT